jgi:hypothetical protein
MKSAHGKSSRGSSAQPVPRGAARAEALAAIAAEARRRMLATPSPLDLITPEEWESFRANPLPEILGVGPERVRKPAPGTGG